MPDKCEDCGAELRFKSVMSPNEPGPRPSAVIAYDKDGLHDAPSCLTRQNAKLREQLATHRQDPHSACFQAVDPRTRAAMMSGLRRMHQQPEKENEDG